MTGYKLTPEQAESLMGQTYDGTQYFNPVQDINGDYFIFAQEVEHCTNESFAWVKDLQPSSFKQQQTEQ